jgi:3-oxoacyl-[acyl-carrier-protein] synthase II
VSERVLLTGIGLVTPLGCDVETVWERLCAGAAGVTAPQRYAASNPPTKALGEVGATDFDRLSAEAEPDVGAADRRTVFALGAARRAMEDAGLAAGTHPRAGASIASGPGAHRPEDLAPYLDAEGRFDALAFSRAGTRLHAGSLLRNAADRPATSVARAFGLGGPVAAVTTACAASSQAIGVALRAIRSGRADWMLAGGADSQNDPLGLAFFVLLGATADDSRPPAESCRPFSKTRTGMVIGEGAGVLVLESESHARARGAHAYAEVAGYGSTLDAHHATAPHPQGRGAVSAMRRALLDAGMAPADVDHVSAHGTATKKNDPVEARAIREVFGEHASRLAVSSLKSMMGHLLAAAGATTCAATALAVERDVIPPTTNLDDPDPACALDHVRGTARRATVRAAMTNAFAFGGHNASVVVRKVRP